MITKYRAYRYPTDERTASQLTVEHLNPPFFSVARPTIDTAPSKLSFNSQFKLQVTIPNNLKASSIQGQIFTVEAYS